MYIPTSKAPAEILLLGLLSLKLLGTLYQVDTLEPTNTGIYNNIIESGYVLL